MSTPAPDRVEEIHDARLALIDRLTSCEEPVVVALRDALSQHLVTADDTAAIVQEAGHDRALDVLIDRAGCAAFGRPIEDYRDRAVWPQIRAELLEAVALLLAATVLIDDETAAGFAPASVSEG